MTDKLVDVIVLGTGVAGASIAMACKNAGKSVAIIDRTDPGGTCSQRGCDPKKILTSREEGLRWAARLRGHGLDVDGIRINWQDAMAAKRRYTEPIPQDTREKFAKNGVEYFQGNARFVGRNAVEINGTRLGAEKIAIATGAEPRPLQFPGGEQVCTSDEFLNLEKMPRDIIFIGGGYITFEFAFLARAAGANVTILSGSNRPLKMFEAELVEQLCHHAKELGIQIHHGARVDAIEKTDGGFRVHAKGIDEMFACGFVIHGAGRVPAIQSLELEKGGITTHNGGIEINKYMQNPGNKCVYAAGDCVAGEGMPLTPVAGIEARAAAHNLLHGNARTPDYRGIPTALFTVPPMASVGLTEEAARGQGLVIEVRSGDMTPWFSHMRLRAEAAGYKVIFDKKTRHIIGAHLLGEGAAEVINLFALAMQHNLTADQLKATTLAYPTHSNDIKYML